MSLITDKESREITSAILAQNFAQAVKAVLTEYNLKQPWLPPATIVSVDTSTYLMGAVSGHGPRMPIDHLFWVSSTREWEKFVTAMPHNSTLTRHIVTLGDAVAVGKNVDRSQPHGLAVVYVAELEGSLRCQMARQIAEDLLASGAYFEVAISGAPYRVVTDITGKRCFEILRSGNAVQDNPPPAPTPMPPPVPPPGGSYAAASFRARPVPSGPNPNDHIYHIHNSRLTQYELDLMQRESEKKDRATFAHMERIAREMEAKRRPRWLGRSAG